MPLSSPLRFACFVSLWFHSQLIHQPQTLFGMGRSGSRRCRQTLSLLSNPRLQRLFACCCCCSAWMIAKRRKPQIDRQTDEETDRLKERWTDRETDKHPVRAVCLSVWSVVPAVAAYIDVVETVEWARLSHSMAGDNDDDALPSKARPFGLLRLCLCRHLCQFGLLSVYIINQAEWQSSEGSSFTL